MSVEANVLLILLDCVLNLPVVLFFTHRIVQLQAERIDEDDGGSSESCGHVLDLGDISDAWAIAFALDKRLAMDRQDIDAHTDRPEANQTVLNDVLHEFPQSTHEGAL